MTEVTTIEEVQHELKTHDPKLAIVNIEMFSDAQVAMIGQLLASGHQEGGVLLLTIYEDPAKAQQMLKAGSRGCVHHAADAEELASAVSTILAGGYYLDSRLGSKVLSRHRPPAEHQLTPRELCILTLIAEGLTNRQIADRLYLSVRTVEGHRAYLRKKLGLHDRSELSKFARQYYPRSFVGPFHDDCG